MKTYIKTNAGKIIAVPRVIGQEWVDAGAGVFCDPVEAPVAESPIKSEPAASDVSTKSAPSGASTEPLMTSEPTKATPAKKKSD